MWISATRIYTAPYEREHLNARLGRSVITGMLIKVIWPGGAEGYSDLMPHAFAGDVTLTQFNEMLRCIRWQELGRALQSDAPQTSGDLRALLQFQAQTLSLIQAPTPLALSIFHNLLDATWRSRGEHCLRNVDVPRSHRLVDVSACQSLEALNRILVESATRGFPALKIKVVGTTSEKLQALSLLGELREAPIPVRLDFNLGLSFRELREFLESRTQPLELPTVEFIEDPCPYVESEWRWLQEHGLPLASDFATSGPCADAATAVVKPVRAPLAPYLESRQRLCVTHSMDSALGRHVAAFWASLVARAFPDRTTHPGLLEGEQSPEWPRCDDGGGFGCSEFLEGVSWRPLLIG